MMVCLTRFCVYYTNKIDVAFDARAAKNADHQSFAEESSDDGEEGDGDGEEGQYFVSVSPFVFDNHGP